MDAGAGTAGASDAPVRPRRLFVAVGAAAAVAGLTSALGSRVMYGHPNEMIDSGITMFFDSLTMPEIAAVPLVATAAVAAIGLVVRAVLARRRRTVPA